jgi:hypothetical protein
MRWIIDDALANTARDGVWVEAGVGIGKGIATMARALIDAGRDDVTLYAVDPFAGDARCGEQQANGERSAHGDWALFLDTMQAHAPEELRRIHVVRATSKRASYVLNNPIDLVIIDADHEYSAVLDDILTWSRLVRRGGTIGGDDHSPEFPGVERACKSIFGDTYEVRAVEHGWPTWRKVIK